MCLEMLEKPCAFETNLSLYWLNCRLRCIPFKFYNRLIADEFYYCICKRRIFTITKPENPDFNYSVAVTARNCFFFCWFVSLVEIKVEILFKHRHNLVRFVSLLGDFFKLINKYKYIHTSPNFQNVEYDYVHTFNFYLEPLKLCLRCCKYHDDYFKPY